MMLQTESTQQPSSVKSTKDAFTKSKRDVSISKSQHKFSDRTKMTQSERKQLITAEELTTIVPDMPTTCQVTGKSAKVLVWKDLVVSVPIMGQKTAFERLKFWEKHTAIDRKEVLHGVSGVAEPGEILAIMGESGAGKTTLMNVLTKRNLKALDIKGEVTVNGEILTLRELQRMSSYVQQADIFMGSVSVREHLIFSARLRMDRKLSDEEKIARVDEVIQQMNLVNCQHTLIGNRFQKSISLGEKKRLAFAAETLTNPSILFCDEPTSGLDAFMAKQVIKALKDLAKDGKTIIITIHQPSSQVYDMFNKLCLMALGEIVYLGPAKKVVNIFKQAGYPMLGRDNPAEYCIAELGLKEDEYDDDRRERVMKIKQAYDDSNMGSMYLNRIHGPISERRKKLGNTDVRTGNKYAASWLTQVIWLTVRSFRATLRDPLLLKVRLIQTLLAAIAVGLVYFQTKLNDNTVLTQSGFLFNTVRDCIFMFIFPVLTVFTDELPVFLRENQGNLYRTDAYFIGKNLAELPQYIVLPLLYSSITSGMSSIFGSAVGKYFIYIALCLISTNLATSIGYAAACIFGTTELATQVLPLITVPIMIFGGFFVKLNTIPDWFVPLKYISWYRYVFEAHMVNRWHDISEEDIQGNKTGNDGKTTLREYDFDEESWVIPKNIGILLFMIVLFRCIAVSALSVRARLVR